MSSPSLIDDTNPAVQYAPGWIWDQLVNEVDHTRHGAATAGLTASLGFYGSGVQVVGTLEPTSNYGQPTTTYKIDGVQQGTYNAPFTASGDTRFNVTFFSKLDLTLDNHEIVITNVNGTSPNTFWLDYFLIYTQTPSGPTTTSTSTSVTPSSTHTNTVVSTIHSTSTTSTTTSSSSTVVLTALASPLSLSATSSSSSSSSSSLSTSTDPTTHSFSDSATTASPSNTSTTSSPIGASPASGSSQSSAHSNTGKIVGGVVGGLAFLALLALLLFCLRRRRRAQDGKLIRTIPNSVPHLTFPADIEPFAIETRERSSSSGTLLGGRSPAAKVNKIPELSLASSTAATSPTSRSYAPTASDMSAQPSELGAPITALAMGGASATRTAGGPSNSSPTSPQHGLSSSDLKLQESLYGPPSARSTPRLGRSPLSPSSGPGSVSAGASDYAPSSATRAPADAEASRARWYAPVQEQSRAQSLLSLLSSRGRRRQDHSQDQDSGLRLYNEPALPPPYTAD